MYSDNKDGTGPASLYSLASEVMKSYGFSVNYIDVIQSGTIKTVWKIGAQDGDLCLKRLKQSYDKSLFSVCAQIHIKNNGGNVPRIILEKTGRPLVEFNGQLFVLYEWLDGRDLNFGAMSDLTEAITGLAKFHKASKGYEPAADARISTKLAKWPDQYRSMKNRMIAWKQIASDNLGNTTCSAYLENVDAMTLLADIALDRLEKTLYMDMTKAGSSKIVLCHQDYGPGNAVLTTKGVVVLDLDGVTMDLPSRDLRKIMGKIAENRNKWDAGNIKEILDWYCQVNPMDHDEKKILYADLLFPHWFFGLVKNRFDKQKQVKATDIEKTAWLEKSKVLILNDLCNKE